MAETIVIPNQTAAGPPESMNFVEGRLYRCSPQAANRLKKYGFAETVERDAIPQGVIVDELPMIANVPDLQPEDIGPTIPHDVSQNELVESVLALREEVSRLKAQLEGRK